MKRIYRNLMIVFVSVGIILFTLLSAGMIQGEFESETKYLTEIVEQVIENIETAKTQYQNKLDLMEFVWLERVKNAEYMISHDTAMQSADTLERIRVLIGAKGIYAFDENGKICLSTDETLLGKTLEGEEELLPDLLAGKSDKEYYYHIEESGFWDDPTFCRMILRSESGKYAALCIDADTKQMGLKCEKTIIDNTLKEASTEYDTSVVAVGMDSGTVLGMTRNNEQRLEVRNIPAGEELLSFLAQAEKRGYAYEMINDERSIISAKEGAGAYIVAYGPMEEILVKTLRQWIRTLLVFLVAMMILLVAIRYNFKKYLLDHLDTIENTLNQILMGDYSVTLEEGNNREINKLIRVIERLKLGYIHKSERTNKIISALGDSIAVFECVYEMDYYFFSYRMKRLLSMGDQEWNKALEQKEQLVELINSLNDSKDENNIVFYRGKYLEIQVYQMEQEVVGVIIDLTSEISKRYALESELKESEKKQGTDSLTKVLNRGGFESCVKKYLSELRDEGVLIALDLDNFKTINDTLGHPAGDEVLKIFASALRDLFRRCDIVGRLGGDEFSVFMTNPVDKDVVDKKMQMVLETVNKRFGDYYRVYGVTVSAGVVFAKEGAEYEALYQKADEALYTAKKEGKNRYCIYQEKE